ncbi:williams-beuren syndrome critical region protein-related [Holotrichia oblita]|uniref:Williams-beuren syndrome critical region protein-related n=1 Tax=Holotrichia oblita TaxID=644536 RepID=A0ACB9SL80_HOLOL|nr:williams-beuren syndrome critical region protein-related [Holotrichia oblita]
MTLAALQADCKRAIAQLRYLNNEELDHILQDNDRLTKRALLNFSAYLKDIASEKETLIEQSKGMAESNLAKEPQLMEGREMIMQLSAEGEELSNRVKEKYDKMKQQSGDMSLETVLALLQTAASETEEESENLAKKFLDNNLEIDEFLEQFLAKRKTVHLRLIKAEKMGKIISRDPMLGSNYVNAPPMGVNANYFPGYPPNPMSTAVPYPMGEFHMPMPRIPYYQHN